VSENEKVHIYKYIDALKEKVRKLEIQLIKEKEDHTKTKGRIKRYRNGMKAWEKMVFSLETQLAASEKERAAEAECVDWYADDSHWLDRLEDCGEYTVACPSDWSRDYFTDENHCAGKRARARQQARLSINQDKPRISTNEDKEGLR